jgi:predicted amidohydrolase YtcJ
MRPWVLALSLSVAGCGGAPGRPAVTEAPRVLVGATILTMDREQPIAGAIVIEGARIVRVLDADDPRQPGRRIDLGGATVVPGLVDAHLHLVNLGRQARTLDLLGTTSAEEVVARVRRAVATTPPGRWIRGRGWDQNDWAPGAFPTHEALSAVSPDHPVWLQRVDGHAVWVNARAMELASIDRSTEAPDGGEILRLPDGAPSGVFVDNAVEMIRAILPPPTTAEIRADLARAMALCREAGLTGVHDMGTDPEVLAVLEAMEREGALPIRVTAYLSGDREAVYPFVATHPPDREGLLRPLGVKLYADGALGSRGAALFAPYADRPGHRGLLVQPPEELARRVRRVHEAGWQAAIHAIGDRGIAVALDAIEAAQGDDTGRRHRVEHVQILRLDDVPRFAAGGIVASMQPTHATSDMPWAADRVGPDRLAGAYAWRTLLDAGALLAFGSDAPVESHRPAWGLYAALTRQDADGEPAGGWTPAERLGLLDALAAFTRGPAEAIGASDLGVIRPGALADLTVLEGDLRALEPRALRDVRVRGTFVAGR